MGDTVRLEDYRSRPLEATSIRRPDRKLAEGLIIACDDVPEEHIASDHTAEPIKRIDDIERISAYFIERERYRDNMLFVVGINFGLRISDLLQLRFSRLIDESGCFRTTFPILEIKTLKSRKVTRNRYITINDAVMDAVTLYLEHFPSRLDEYMFKGVSNRCGKDNDKPMRRESVSRILKEATSELGITAKVSTHTLRKTFGYHQMAMSGNDPRKLLLLQKMFGHSSSAMTMEYIGITNEEIEEAYQSLNLAGQNCYAKFSRIGQGA